MVDLIVRQQLINAINKVFPLNSSFHNTIFSLLLLEYNYIIVDSDEKLQNPNLYRIFIRKKKPIILIKEIVEKFEVFHFVL